MSSTSPLGILVVASLAAACQRDERVATTADAATPPRVRAARLADSVWLVDDETGDSLLLRRVVLTDSAANTLKGVLTAEPPVVLGDTAVSGLLHDGGIITAGFVYDPRSRTVARLRLPESPLSGSAPSSRQTGVTWRTSRPIPGCSSTRWC